MGEPAAVILQLKLDDWPLGVKRYRQASRFRVPGDIGNALLGTPVERHLNRVNRLLRQGWISMSTLILPARPLDRTRWRIACAVLSPCQSGGWRLWDTDLTCCRAWSVSVRSRFKASRPSGGRFDAQPSSMSKFNLIPARGWPAPACRSRAIRDLSRSSSTTSVRPDEPERFSRRGELWETIPKSRLFFWPIRDSISTQAVVSAPFE